MKVTGAHKSAGLMDVQTGFSYLTDSFRDSIKSWNYFVNWEKVYNNSGSLKRELYLWNSLLGSSQFDQEFLDLLEEYPNLVRSIPALIVRDGSKSQKFELVIDLAASVLEQEYFDFTKPATSDESRKKALMFVKQTGLEGLFTRSGVTNVFDYMVGVEAGLDSNGRKNRSGSTMELVVEHQISRIAEANGYRWIPQATASSIKSEFGFDVKTDKSSRSFDFAVTDGSRLLLVETNFYGAGGSKLKSVAGEFTQLSSLVSTALTSFVWITDGAGWKTALAPLRETFEKIDHIFSLAMVGNGFVESAMQES